MNRRWRWWHAYAALVALSAISQTFIWPGLPGALGPSERQRSVEVEPEGRDPATLVYREYGDADSPRKLVLLHGSPAPTPNFTKLGARLEGVHAVAVDMPGFGGSPAGVGDYGIDAQGDYAMAFMDAIGWERASVLGYSLGSGTALCMFDAAPDRIESLIFYGGIGIMEGEGSGDYHFEQLKYRVGYALVVVGFETVPHFGLLGKRSLRHAWLRSFTDTDQRPLRDVLGQVNDADVPMLIVHDHNDPLVPADTAREHHSIVRHSQLVMLDYGHGGVFSDEGAAAIATEVNRFLSALDQPGYQPTRRTVDPYEAVEPAVVNPLPFGWDLKRKMGPWRQMGIIVVASYLLEDPTTVFTGLMVKAGQVDLFVALFAIFVGIFTGDLLLYGAGFVAGRRALRWKPVAARLPVRHVERLGDWFDTHGWKAVLASRFIPGTRLPLYVSAGALGKKPGRFALWTACAVAIWSVVMVAAILLLGEAASSPFRVLFGNHWLALVATIVLLVVVLRFVQLMLTTVGRGKLKARIAQLWWWEFWPLWVFYTPVCLYIGTLVIRFRGLGKTTATNPGIAQSGYVEESKCDILDHLPPQWVLDYARVDSAEQVLDAMQTNGWSFPIILKPDNGYRGRGLRKADHADHIVEYFGTEPGPTVAQVFHPGPYEAGVFYCRRPGEPTGRIFSVTTKQLGVLTGDGKHTLEQLIYRHRRYRMQAGVFLRRFGDERDRVLAEGERLTLGTAMNHCQGAVFGDGAHLVTPELEQAFDGIARSFDGFYFGRFDVRYADEDAFKAGRDFAIIELNGVTSESTNIYDTRFTLWRAWATLMRQWYLAFEIGSANARAGATTTSTWRLTCMAARHFRRRRTGRVSD